MPTEKKPPHWLKSSYTPFHPVPPKELRPMGFYGGVGSLSNLPPKQKVTIYTDACASKTGLGAAAFVADLGDGMLLVDVCLGTSLTTSRAELLAAVRALQLKPFLPSDVSVVVRTDSTMVAQGFDEWVVGWKASGWMTASGTPVKNADLWVTATADTGWTEYEWTWVKGHSGVLGNELADSLAGLAKDALTVSGGAVEFAYKALTVGLLSDTESLLKQFDCTAFTDLYMTKMET